MDKELKNQPCYDKDGNFIGWFSRSTAATIVVLAENCDEKLFILASERGPGAADFNGKWNLPCGYIDFNETALEAACRECFEETGVSLDPDSSVFIGYEDSPTANRQNITFRFMNVIMDRKIEDIEFSKENNEKDEVGQIMWVDIDHYGDFEWAFGHDKIIERVGKLVREAKESLKEKSM